MNKNQARKILGLDGTEDEKTEKKKYRKLMLEHHPENKKSYSTTSCDIIVIH